MDIETFKARNLEAQKLNAEIQRAQGALEENKRQFEALCAEYKATYGEELTAETLEAEMNSVLASVTAMAQAQAQAIEAAKSGVIVSEEVDNSVSGTAPAQVAPAPVQNPVPTQVASVPAQNPAPAFVAPTPAPNIFGSTGISAPTPASEPARPMSASVLTASALAQSAGAPNIPDPLAQAQSSAPENTIKATNGIPGWGNPNQSFDFSAMMGGKFGG